MNRNCDQTTGWTTDVSGFNSQLRQTDISISTLSSPPQGSTQRRIQGAKGSGDDNEHSAASNADKNEWSCTSTPCTSSRPAA